MLTTQEFSDLENHVTWERIEKRYNLVTWSTLRRKHITSPAHHWTLSPHTRQTVSLSRHTDDVTATWQFRIRCTSHPDITDVYFTCPA